ncbi:unnamed protein product [Paramecium octaurelia]|uniref:Uncharacterized protein n=1 Tax=Paramecium octaurelia TaxID=43137 RepID=A0A8S1SN20_PAROT|nr:unnamed protein product [Paramecium octaurelia]
MLHVIKIIEKQVTGIQQCLITSSCLSNASQKGRVSCITGWWRKPSQNSIQISKRVGDLIAIWDVSFFR